MGSTADEDCDSKELALLNDDIFSGVLARVSEARGSYNHACVCRRWLALSPLSQTRVQVRFGANISEGVLLRQLQGFSNLTSLDLRHNSVDPLSDVFLGGVSLCFPKLRDFNVALHQDPERHCVSSLGLCSFVDSMTNLTSLVFIPGRVVPGRGVLRPVLLPHNIVRLARLEFLNFGVCSSVPSSVGTVVSLRHLQLKGCPQSPPILPDSITDLVHLTSLSLRDVRNIPPNIGALTALTLLSLQNFSPPELPFSITHLSLLEDCTLSNGFAALPDNLDRLSSLKSLTLMECSEIRQLPPGLCLLRQLEHLVIRACASLEEIRGEWGQLGQLRTLEIGGCSRLEQLPPSLGRLRSLETLDLWKLWTLTQLPQDLSGLQSLRFMILKDLGMLTSLPDSMSRLSNLESLWVRGSPELAAVPRAILELPQLIECCKNQLSQFVK